MVSFLIERIAADSILEKAYDWLCQKRAIAHITRLYEQGADSTSIGKYVTRWATWCRSGIRVAGIRQGGGDAEGVV
jgi:hypothetical protein